MEVIVTTAVESSNTVVREIFMAAREGVLFLCQTIEGSVKHAATNSHWNFSCRLNQPS